MRSLLFLDCLSLEDGTHKLSQYVSNYQSTLCHIPLTLRHKPEITLHIFVVLLSLARMLSAHILGLVTGNALRILW